MTDTASDGTAADPHAGLILERMTLEPAGKRLRAVFGGAVIAESEAALVLSETVEIEDGDPDFMRPLA